MTDSNLFELTKDFIENKKACVEAITELKKGAEIRLVLDERIECACFNNGQKPVLEQRVSANADVEFRIKPEAIRRLHELPADNLTDTGIEILREVASDQIQIRLVGSVAKVLTDGYLGIIRKAGPDFFSFLAQKGLTNIFKIISHIKSMKKN